jgi:type II secretion system protein H
MGLSQASTTGRDAAAGGRSGFAAECIARAAPRLAFTLIEMVIVLLVIGILAAVAAPKLSNSIRQQSVNAAAKKIAADLELARRTAKSSGASIAVQFDVAMNQYTLLTVKDINHPVIQNVTQLSKTGYAATLTSAAFNGTNSKLTFDLYGQPFAGSPLAPLTAGSVVIKAGNVQRTIAVNPTTGKAQIQ